MNRWVEQAGQAAWGREQHLRKDLAQGLRQQRKASIAKALTKFTAFPIPSLSSHVTAHTPPQPVSEA